MKRAIIATIGEGRYDKAKVFFKEEEIGIEEFAPLTLAKKKGLELILVGIETEETKKAIEKYGLKECKRELVEEGSDREIFEKTLNIIFKLIIEGYDEIYIDFTHAFRHIGYYVLMSSLLMASTFKNKTKITIIYGKYERYKNLNIKRRCKNCEENNEEAKVPEIKGETKYEIFNEYIKQINDIVEIKKAVEKLDIKAIEYFEEEYREDIKNLEKKIGKKEGKEKNRLINEKNSIRELLSILSEVKMLVLNLLLGNVHDDFIKEFKNKYKELEENKDKLDIQRKILVHLLLEELKSIYHILNNERVSVRQKELGKYFWKKAHYHLGIALIREAFSSRVLENQGQDPYVKYRECIESDFFKKNDKKIGDITIINDVRNSLEHVLSKEGNFETIKGAFNVEVNKKIIKKIKYENKNKKTDAILEKVDELFDKIDKIMEN